VWDIQQCTSGRRQSGWPRQWALNPPSRSTLIFFGIAAVWTYVLAILSIKRLSARLNPRVWRIVLTFGVEYIALAFLTDFAKNLFAASQISLSTYHSSPWPLPDPYCG
jgi:hypothetical protein